MDRCAPTCDIDMVMVKLNHGSVAATVADSIASNIAEMPSNFFQLEIKRNEMNFERNV